MLLNYYPHFIDEISEHYVDQSSVVMKKVIEETIITLSFYHSLINLYS